MYSSLYYYNYLSPYALLWHVLYISQYRSWSNELCMTYKYYLARKINQHGGKYNCIETPVTNWRFFTALTEINEQIKNFQIMGTRAGLIFIL